MIENYFRLLGERVHAGWAHRQFHEEYFPEVAGQALEELPPHESVTPAALLRWVRRAPLLPRQPDLEGKFGEPPLCLYWTQRFYIQALFWLNATTSIHQHGFSGVFYVLAGSSIHTRYQFRAEDIINGHLRLGALSFREAELLSRGQARPIFSGDRLIHALFHLDRPSVTVVIRTHHDPHAGPQFEYLRPGLARDPFHREDQLTRVSQSLGLMRNYDREGYEAALDELAAHPEYPTALAALEQALIGGARDERLRDLIDRTVARHGERAAILPPLFEERLRQLVIVNRRRLVEDPEHRFFLALLLNLPDQETLMRMVRERYPERDPRRMVMDWIDQLSRLPVVGELGPNPLGVQMSEDELAIFAQLLSDNRPDAIIERLRAEYDLDGQEADVQDLCRALRSSPLFKALFT